MDHKLKGKIYKTLRRKQQRNLCDLRLGKEFLDQTLKAQFIREKKKT
jgi:hypothetical protein